MPPKIKKPKWNDPPPPKHYGEENCVFPTRKDDVSFQKGDLVCVKIEAGEKPVAMRFYKVDPYDNNYYVVGTDVMTVTVPWQRVGTLNAKMVSKVATAKKLPEDIEKNIKRMTGSRRKRRTRRRITSRA